MQRIVIRSAKSKKSVKPRVFDALVDGDDVYLEVKNKKGSEIIALSDVLTQIAEAMPKQASKSESQTTEP